jgi:UDP-N-acetylglucosamine/UDP-N-acetylgalactosamine diphosphorylase
MSGNQAELRQVAAEYGQEHLFQYWQELDSAQREQLLGDVARIDFPLVARLAREGATAAGDIEPDRIEPAPVYPAEPGAGQREYYMAAREAGQRLLRENKVAVMVVAGGQGTRLGYDGPKGTLAISPVRNKSLFQLFAESIRATCARYGCRLPWYIMTSSATDKATREYFAANKYLGLDPASVRFFEQGVMPAVDDEGRILLAERHRVALSPNGHGGTLAALKDSGVLAEMNEQGIEALSYFQVDNPLVTPADPFFLGLHTLAGSQVSSIAVRKAEDLERVGNFVRVNGKVQIIEYSDLPEDLARAKNPDGSRKLDFGSVAIHAFDRAFIETLTDGGNLALPWHVARKKVAHVDLRTGRTVDPEKPNAIKFEMFIFDSLPLADRAVVVERPRGEVFSPVKNATGVDSPETAQRDIALRGVAWLRAAGAKVPSGSGAQAPAVVEISPLFALDADQLREKLKTPPTLRNGEELYLS